MTLSYGLEMSKIQTRAHVPKSDHDDLWPTMPWQNMVTLYFDRLHVNKLSLECY